MTTKTMSSTPMTSMSHAQNSGADDNHVGLIGTPVATVV